MVYTMLYVVSEIYSNHGWVDPLGWLLFFVMSNLSNLIGAVADGLTKTCLVFSKLFAFAVTGETVVVSKNK